MTANKRAKNSGWIDETLSKKADKILAIELTSELQAVVKQQIAELLGIYRFLKAHHESFPENNKVKRQLKAMFNHSQKSAEMFNELPAEVKRMLASAGYPVPDPSRYFILKRLAQDVPSSTAGRNSRELEKGLLSDCAIILEDAGFRKNKAANVSAAVLQSCGVPGMPADDYGKPPVEHNKVAARTIRQYRKKRG